MRKEPETIQSATSNAAGQGSDGDGTPSEHENMARSGSASSSAVSGREDPPMVGKKDEKKLNDAIAEIESKESASKIAARAALLDALLPYFRMANLVTLGVLIGLVVADFILVLVSEQFKPSDRLVTTGVLMALIGATVVQTGSIVLLSAQWAFNKSSK